jgi:hypothetical protein
MIRRIAPLVGLLATLALTSSAAAAPSGSVCQLQATVTPAKPYTFLASADEGPYSMSGTLSGCQGTYAEKSANVSVGKNIRIGSVDYKPMDAGIVSGTCAAPHLTGRMAIQWDNGKLSVFEFNTAATTFTGTFVPGSVTLQRVTPDPLNPSHTSDTFPLAYGLDTGSGQQASNPNASACAGAGAASLGITGVLSHSTFG